MMVLFTKRAFVVLSWTLLVALSVYFFMDNVVAYFYGYRSRIWGSSFFHNQAWVAMHMTGGTLTLLLGPLQFWNWLRARYRQVHRTLGKLYMFGVLLAGLSALRLGAISTCVPCRISLILLAIFALLSTSLAWKAIKSKNIKAHRQFMVRSYICIMAFVAVRIDDIFPLDFLFGAIEDRTFRRVVNEYFFSFVPLIIGEIFMTWLPAVRILSTTKKQGREKQII